MSVCLHALGLCCVIGWLSLLCCVNRCVCYRCVRLWTHHNKLTCGSIYSLIPQAANWPRAKLCCFRVVVGSLSSVSTWSPLQVMAGHSSADILIPVNPADPQSGTAAAVSGSRHSGNAQFTQIAQNDITRINQEYTISCNLGKHNIHTSVPLAVFDGGPERP